MAKGNALAIALSEGIKGWMAGTQYVDRQAREEEDRAMRRQEHDARMGEVQRINSDRVTLATAAAPQTGVEGAGGAIRLSTADDRDVDGTAATVTTPQAMTAYNSQPATTERMAQALRVTARPMEAMALENGAFQQGRARIEAGRVDQAYAKKLSDEGVLEGLKHFRSGNVTGMLEAFNKNGTLRIANTPTLVEEERTMPWGQKVKTFSGDFEFEGPDGKKIVKRMNSHDLTVQHLPYEQQLKFGLDSAKEAREGRETDSKVTEATAKAAYYNALADDTSRGANARAGGKTPGASKMDQDDVLQVQEAGKQLQAAQKLVNDAMGTLGPKDNPDAAPAVVHARQQLRAAQQQHLRIGVKTGLVTSEDLLTQIMGEAKNDQQAMAALSRLADLVGPEKADEVANMMTNSDAWKRLPKTVRAPITTKTGQAARRAEKYPGSISLQGDGEFRPPGAAAAPMPAAAAGAPIALSAGAPAGAAPADMGLALGANTGNAAIDGIRQEQVPQFQAIGEAIAQAKAQLAAAARSGDPKVLPTYAENLQKARALLDNMVSKMNPAQADAIRKAAGYY